MTHDITISDGSTTFAFNTVKERGLDGFTWRYKAVTAERIATSDERGEHDLSDFWSHRLTDWSGGEGQLDYSAQGASLDRFLNCNQIDISKQGQVALHYANNYEEANNSPQYAPLVEVANRLYVPYDDGSAAPSSIVMYCASGNGTSAWTTGQATGANTGHGRWGCSDGRYAYFCGGIKSTIAAAERYVMIQGETTNWADWVTTQSTTQDFTSNPTHWNGNIYVGVGRSLKKIAIGTAATPTDISGTAYDSKLFDVTTWEVVRTCLHLNELWYAIASGETYQLWSYDGTGHRFRYELPSGSALNTMKSEQGVLWLGLYWASSKTEPIRPAYIADGSFGWLGTLERTRGMTDARIADFVSDERYLYMPYSYNNSGYKCGIYRYDLSTGALAPTIDEISETSLKLRPGGAVIFTGRLFWTIAENAAAATTKGGVYDVATTYPTNGTLITSRTDMGTAALKLIREVEIEHLAISDEAADGSIKVEYSLDTDPTAPSWTEAGTNSTAGSKGTTFTLNVTGRTIQLRITLTRGTAATPTLTGVTVRAIPLRNAKREFTLLLNLQKGSLGPRGYAGDTVTSATKRSNLHTILTAQAALTLTDPTGTTYTCLPSGRASPLEYNPVIESADGTKRKLEVVGKLVLEEI